MKARRAGSCRAFFNFEKMVLDTSCFDGVVGLARCECPCRVETAPEGYNDADSGLYITDLVSFTSMEAAEDCSDPQNPWNVLERAMEEAKVKVLSDINAGLMKTNQFSRHPWRGMIGEKLARETLAISTTYAGVRISAARIKGGYYRITSIGGCFNATGSISVRIYDRFNATVGAAVVISAVAGQHVSTSCDITLPLWVDGATHAEYFAVYTVNQSNLPRATRLFCSPCAKKDIPTFSTENPYYNRRWTGSEVWANWMMVGAWAGNSLSEFDMEAEEVLSGNGMNGITISGELTCSPSTVVCVDDLDFSDPVALSLAHAIRYQAAMITAEKVIRNPEPYQSAVASREILAADIPTWEAAYQEQIKYIQYNANTKAADCIFCKPKYSMSVETKTP